MNSERDAWKGRLQIVLAATLWSTSGFFAKAPWFDAWPAESRGLLIAFWRSLFAALVLLPLIRKPTFRWPMLPMVMCFATMVWSFMSAMVHGPAANAIWLQYLCPVWVMLASVVLFKEKRSGSDIRMFGFCLAGVALILGCEMLQGRAFYATILGLLSGFAMAGVLLCMRGLREVDSAWLITLNQVGTVVLLAPWAWMGHQPIDASAYWALGFFGIFQMSIPYVLFARGLRGISSAEGSVLALIEPILVPAWVYLAWHHHPTYVAPAWWTWVGGSLITIGLLERYLPAMIRSLRLRKRKSPSAAVR
ncbi:MAG: DMT family transporter [Planctomycetaceae bacterium]